MRWHWLDKLTLVVAALWALAGAAAAVPGERLVEEMQGFAAFRSGDYRKAAECFQKALDKDPASARLNFNYAVALLKGGDKEKAKDIFKKIFDPDHLEETIKALYNWTCLEHDEAREAAAPLRPYLWWPEKVPPTQIEEMKKTAEAALKRYDSLLSDYREVVSRTPQDDRFRRNLEIAVRERQEIEDFLRRLQQLTPPAAQQQGGSSESNSNQQNKSENQGSGQQQQQSGQNQQQNANQQDQQQQQGNSNQSQGQQQNSGQQGQQQQQQSGQQPENQNQAQGSSGQNQSQQQGQQPQATPTPQPDQQSGDQHRNGEGQQEGQKPQKTPGKAHGSGSSGQPQKDNEKDSGSGEENEPELIGQMSREDARRLLNSVPGEDKNALLRLMGAGRKQQPYRPEQGGPDW
jgi:hypothetical protein